MIGRALGVGKQAAHNKYRAGLSNGCLEQLKVEAMVSWTTTTPDRRIGRVARSDAGVTPDTGTATDRSTCLEEANMADSVECAYCGQKKSERVKKCPHCGNG